MKRVLTVVVGFLLLCSTAFAQDESEGTVSVVANVGLTSPQGDFKDGAKSGMGGNIGLAWMSGDYRAAITFGMDKFGKKNGVSGAFLPVSLGYSYRFYSFSSIDLYGGADFATRLGNSDFKQSFFSFSPAVGGAMKFSDDLSVHLDIKYHLLLEDPRTEYLGVTVGIAYAIMK